VSAVALLGGETSRKRLGQVLEAFGARVRADELVSRLVATRWLVEPQQGWLALPTRTHRKAVLELVHDARTRAWHRAVAETLENTAGPLGRADAAYHAAKAGEGAWAARLALDAARSAGESQLEESATRLAAFARAVDPSGEEQARGDVEDGTSVERARGPSVIPRQAQPEAVAEHLTELARQALLAGDAGSLDRWCNGLEATGERAIIANRLRAMAHLSHGQIANAVLALRRMRAQVDQDGASASSRCQASLALGVALAHAGSVDDALLYGLEALARAREGEDENGEHACVMFLAKLFEGVGHAEAGAKLRGKVFAVVARRAQARPTE